MNKSVIFIIKLIIISYCLNSRSIYFERVLDNLVELNKEAGKDNNDLAILISQVSEALNQSHGKFSSFYDGLSKTTGEGINLLGDYIKKVESDKLAAKAAENAAEKEIALINIDRGKLASELTALQKQLEDLKQQIAKEVEDFRKFGAEAEQKLMVIKTLKDIITDELLNPSSGKAFIQLQTFNDKIKELKTLLENSAFPNIYNPLFSKLLELAESKGFSDQKVIGEILGVLNNLEKNLKEFRQKQDSDGKTTIKNLKSQTKQKIIQIKTTAKLLNEANSNFKRNERIVQESKNDQEILEKETVRKNQELRNWEEMNKSEVQMKDRETKEKEKMSERVKEISTELLNIPANK